MRKGKIYFMVSVIVATIFICQSLCAQNLEYKEIESQETNSIETNWMKPNYLPIDQSSILESYKREPSFGICHDNYFITGAPINKEINKSTADIKFQISIRQLLFKNLLPRNQILALTYTQKSFWNIYETSDRKSTRLNSSH